MNHVYLYVRILDPVTTDLGTSPVYWSNSSFRGPGSGSDHHIPTSGVQGGAHLSDLLFTERYLIPFGFF